MGHCRIPVCTVARSWTPLHCAAANGNAAATATLLGAGADVAIKNISGYAALRCAARPTATATAPVPAGGRRSKRHVRIDSIHSQR
jgi:ankyrin repeat protein